MRHAIAQTIELIGVASVLAGAYILAGIGLVAIIAGLAAGLIASRVDNS